MIHYHGLPITPATAAVRAISGGHAFVSYAHPIQLTLAAESAQSFAVDNGAFSAWKVGSPVTNWSGYYEWVDGIKNCPTFDFAVIPDVIDGTESDNDALLTEWPFERWVGAPVWHMNESFDRLERLAAEWPRVCLGSSGEYAEIGTSAWWSRIGQAMDVVCNDGFPVCKLHGLRMLNPEVFTQLPFASADSTNIARNIGVDSAWRGTYMPPNKEARAAVMRERIESQQAAVRWEKRPRPIQADLLEAI